jgi:hypothetical protein
MSDLLWYVRIRDRVRGLRYEYEITEQPYI